VAAGRTGRDKSVVLQFAYDGEGMSAWGLSGNVERLFPRSIELAGEQEATK